MKTFDNLTAEKIQASSTEELELIKKDLEENRHQIKNNSFDKIQVLFDRYFPNRFHVEQSNYSSYNFYVTIQNLPAHIYTRFRDIISVEYDYDMYESATPKVEYIRIAFGSCRIELDLTKNNPDIEAMSLIYESLYLLTSNREFQKELVALVTECIEDEQQVRGYLRDIHVELIQRDREVKKAVRLAKEAADFAHAVYVIKQAEAKNIQKSELFARLKYNNDPGENYVVYRKQKMSFAPDIHGQIIFDYQRTNDTEIKYVSVDKLKFVSSSRNK